MINMVWNHMEKKTLLKKKKTEERYFCVCVLGGWVYILVY